MSLRSDRLHLAAVAVRPAVSPTVKYVLLFSVLSMRNVATSCVKSVMCLTSEEGRGWSMVEPGFAAEPRLVRLFTSFLSWSDCTKETTASCPTEPVRCRG